VRPWARGCGRRRHFVRPDLIGEFKDKIILLQQKKPLRGPANGVLQKMFDEALAV
jgi:hypothetical protein